MRRNMLGIRSGASRSSKRYRDGAAHQVRIARWLVWLGLVTAGQAAVTESAVEPVAGSVTESVTESAADSVAESGTAAPAEPIAEPSPALDMLLAHPGFVGAEVCAGCHAPAYSAWSTSHHHAAMLPATPENVVADFNDVAVSYGGVRTRFIRRGDEFFIHTDGPDGQSAEFPVRYTFGITPLQQFLLPLDGGRLQAFPIAWDSRSEEAGGQRWFHLYPDDVHAPGGRLHWTGADMNWNHMCAECHSTDLIKAYDAEQRAYRTSYAEVNVACESCHGPGAKHVAWASMMSDGRLAGNGTSQGGLPSHAGMSSRRNAPTQAIGSLQGSTRTQAIGSSTATVDEPVMGLMVQFNERAGVAWNLDTQGRPVRSTPRAAQQEIDTCARCHSRRGRLAQAVEPGADTEQSHRLALLEEGLYHVDGQVDDEVYVLGSFLQSRMYAAGVTCSDCHDPHSLKLRAPDDEMCLSCHRGQSLDAPAHHHHPKESAGARCVNCHMPVKTFMQVDARHDHSFRIPRPDLSVEFGVPNACTACHTERDAGWAAARVVEWYGETRNPGLQNWAETFFRARQGNPDAVPDLLALAGDADQPAIARATAARALGDWLSPKVVDALTALSTVSDARIRRAAVGALGGSPLADRAAAMAPALADPVTSVRVTAMHALRIGGLAATSTPQAPALQALAQILGANTAQQAFADYAQALAIDADRPEGQIALALDALAIGDTEAATSAYREALRIEPGHPVALVNLADLMRRDGRDAAAGALFEAYLQPEPDPAVAHAYGLWLVRGGQTDAALKFLRFAAESAPEQPRYAYVFAVALDSTGDSARAQEVAAALLERHPWHAETLAAMVTWAKREGTAPGEAATRVQALHARRSQ